MTSGPPAKARDTEWEDLTGRQRRGLLASVLARTTLTAAGLLVLYAMAPLGREATATTIGIMVIGSVLLVAMVGVETRALSRSPHPILRVVETIANVLVVFILAFALVYLSMAQIDPDAFSEPLTKVSAVYFTVTVLATVGFGDITPVTDTTRIVVTMQMMLGLTLIAVVLRFMITFAQNLQSQRRSAAGATPTAALPAGDVAGSAVNDDTPPHDTVGNDPPVT
jgi:Ni/Fe-hydrogenase subunit HybB-like protein